MSKFNKTETPTLAKRISYVIAKHHKVFLKCATSSSTIHYTTDGSTPSNLAAVFIHLYFDLTVNKFFKFDQINQF